MSYQKPSFSVFFIHLVKELKSIIKQKCQFFLSLYDHLTSTSKNGCVFIGVIVPIDTKDQ